MANLITPSVEFHQLVSFRDSFVIDSRYLDGGDSTGAPARSLSLTRTTGSTRRRRDEVGAAPSIGGVALRSKMKRSAELESGADRAPRG